MPAPLRDRRLVLSGLVLISLTMALVTGPPLTSWVGFAISWAVSLLYTAVLGLGNRAIWAGLRTHLPQLEQTQRRLWYLALGSVAYTSLATLALTAGLPLVLVGAPRVSGTTLLLIIGINLVPTLIGQLVYESRHSFQQWSETRDRADQLARAATQAQLDALQRQLDPHFLFNSLNTLSALIEPGNQPAQHYVEGLADVYRYVLLARHQPTVPLAEELAFVRTYLALQQVRFGQGLVVEWAVAAAPPAARVAPLSVQELVENALKHNEASRARPLTVRVLADAATVRVENTYQPRPAGLAPGTGTGLAGLRQRYALLGAPQPVVVGQAGDIFVVTLPLLAAPVELGVRS